MRGTTIVVDTRQQEGKHDGLHEGLQELGYRLLRSKVPFGDYVLAPSVSVDTKKDLYELAKCIDQDHERFKREQAAARDAGCQLVILTFNKCGVRSLTDLAKWDEPDEHFQMRMAKSGNKMARRISGQRMAKACKTLEVRYGFRFAFCSDEDGARVVSKILGGGEDVGGAGSVGVVCPEGMGGAANHTGDEAASDGIPG